MVAALWCDALLIDAIGIQMHGVHALPVARGAFPSKRISLPCGLVQRCASKQNVLIEVGMTLRWCYEPGRAVTMNMVTPVYQFAHPGARGV